MFSHFEIDRTAIGIRVKDGVVLAVEKLIQSKLLVPGSNRRIQNVDRHIGIVRKREKNRQLDIIIWREIERQLKTRTSTGSYFFF